MAPIIRIDDLVKTPHKLTVVDDVSFDVEAGAIFGFLGHNGAVMSTTIKMLATLLKPIPRYLPWFNKYLKKEPMTVR